MVMRNLSNRMSEEKSLFPHGCILMSNPKSYSVKYEINPWMQLNSEDKEKATRQWQMLRNAITRLGAFVEVVTPTVDNPDFVFAANAGLIYENKFVVSKFRHKERQGEESQWRSIFSDLTNNEHQQCFSIISVHTSNFCFEGAGDWLPLKKSLYVAGCGFRSTKESNKVVGKLLKVDVIHMRLVDPYFYHLDTCFCPLSPSEALIFPGAFYKNDMINLNKEIDLIEVIEAEAKKFACNAVVLGENIIIPAGCPVLTDLLEKKGYKVYPIELSEFIKSGGAAKCLTLKLY